MSECRVCPSCGYNLHREEPFVDGRLTFDYDTGLIVDGRPIPLSYMMRQIVGSLIAARGERLSTDAILLRIGSEGEANTIAVQISRIRKVFRDAGLPELIQSRRGRGEAGYRWVMHALPRLSPEALAIAA